MRALVKICKCHLILKYGIRLLLAGRYIFCNIRSLLSHKITIKKPSFFPVGHSHSSRSSSWPGHFRFCPSSPSVSPSHPPSFLPLPLFQQPSSPHSNIALLGKSAHTLSDHASFPYCFIAIHSRSRLLIFLPLSSSLPPFPNPPAYPFVGWHTPFA